MQQNATEIESKICHKVKHKSRYKKQVKRIKKSQNVTNSLR